MTNSIFDISGMKILFTGASGGLGLAMSRALLEAGASVVMLGSSGKCRALADAYAAEGLSAYGLRCNLEKPAELELAFTQALELLGGEINGLVNAAGIQRRSPSQDFSKDDWDTVINVDLTVPFMLCQLAGKKMIEQGKGGKIINFASMLSFFGGYTVPAYAAAKGGVAQLTKALCNEWARYGINVNAIAPGYMDTPMNAALTVPSNPRYSQITGRIPAGRWGTGEDLAGLGIFLLSRASDYINGAVIPCDGGYLVN